MKKIVLSFLLFCFAIAAVSAQQASISAPVVSDESTVFPKFLDGGDNGLAKYLAKNVKTPAGDRKAGAVIVYFWVDTEGVASGHRVFRSIGSPEHDAAALEAVKSIARWTPGTMAGKTRKMGTKVSVDF